MAVRHAVERAVADLLQQGRYGHPVIFEFGTEPGGAQPVDQFERSVFPVVAEPHGGIDGRDIVGDFRRQVGGVGQRAREHLPAVPAALVAMFHERPQAALLGGGDAVELGARSIAVFARVKVARLFDPFAGAAVEVVEATLALAACIAGLDHRLDQFGLAIDGVKWIVLVERAGEAAQHVRHQVESDQIEQPEDAGFGNPHRPADHRVGLLDRDAVFDRRDDGALQPVGADPVGDETRRVVAVDHRLAERYVEEGAKRFDPVRRDVRAANQFQQPHVARRVEEMGDQEVATKEVRHAFRQGRERNGRCVGGDERSILAHRFQLLIERAFDIGSLDDRLDDPVAVGHAVEMIIDIAGRDAFGVALVHKGRGIGLDQPFDRAFGDRIAVDRAFRNDIEQHDRHAGIGDVGCDSGTHHPGADHRDLFDTAHDTASRIVAMPWPPPIHCVDSA